MKNAIVLAWRSDRRALFLRLVLLFYSAFFMALEAPDLAPAGREALFVVGACALGAVLTGIVLVVRVKFRVPDIQKCSFCFAKNELSAETCRKCGFVFHELPQKTIAPSLWIVPYGHARHHIATWIMIGSFAAIVATLFLVPREFRGVCGVFLWTILFSVHDITYGVLFRGVREQLVEHNGCLCIRCAFPIGASMKRCPECGRGCSIEEAQELWARAGLWFPPRPLRDEPRAPASGLA
jgi:ribosomal protein L40E